MTRKIKPWLKWGCLAPVSLMAVILLTLFLMDLLLPSAARRALPKSATEVQEYYSGGLNDYLRVVRAKLPETDYPLYAKNLGLIERFDPETQANIANIVNMGFGDAPSWWTPPPADSTTYFEQKRKHSLRVLKRSAGSVYFASTSW